MKKLVIASLPFALAGLSLLLLAAATPAVQAMVICQVPGDHLTIQAAVNDFSCDTVEIDAGTYMENVMITRDVALIGAGPGSTTVDGGGVDSVFNISAQVEVWLQDMSITNGDGSFGGGVRVIDSTVTLDNVHILRNTAVQSGGGLYNYNGHVTIRNSQIVANEAQIVNGGGIYQAFITATLFISNSLIAENISPNDGGGIYSSGGAVTVLETLIRDNEALRYGGGIANATGQVTITETQIFSNTAANRGGAVDNTGTFTATGSSLSYNRVITTPTGRGGGLGNIGTAVLRYTTLAYNSSFISGGGVWNGNIVRLHHSTITDNQASNGSSSGGGILNSIGAVAEVEASTISRNTASTAGGGIANSGIISLTNSTVSGNHADGGGGLYNWQTAVIRFSTFSENGALQGGNIFAQSETISLTHTLITDFDGGANCGFAASTIVSLGYNMDSDDTCNLTQPTDQPDAEPMLGPLQANGGATETHALLPGSPAIDAGDNGLCPATDQRDIPRPFGAACDIGAYEFGFYLYLPVILR